MRLLTAVVFVSLILPARVDAQIVELVRNPSTQPGQPPAVKANRTEYFGRSGAELFFEGPAQASVQIVKLRIGELAGYNLPLYVLVGAAGDALSGESKQNEATAATLLNPMGGSVNVSIIDTYPIWATGEHTSLRVAFQASGKLLNGKKQGLPDDVLATFTGFGDIGLRYQTGAWEPPDTGNMGILWIQAKVVAHWGAEEHFQQLFGPDAKGHFWGYSVDGGVEINDKVNLKLGVYGTFGTQAMPLFSKPYVKFAFDYKVDKSKK